MITRRLGLICQLLVFFLLVCFTGAPAQADNNLNELIRKTKKQLSQQKKKEKSVLNSLLNSQRTLERSEKKLENINHRLSQTQNNIKATQGALNQLEKNLTDLDKKQADRRLILNTRLVALYKYGPGSYFQVFLGAKNFADFVSRFETARYYLLNDLAVIKELSSVQRRIKLEQAEFAQKQVLLEKQEEQYASLQEQAEGETEKYSQSVEKSQKQLATIQEDRKRLEAALKEYERTSQEIARQIRRTQSTGGARLGTGEMIWPVRGRISSPFGSRYHPVLKKKKYHNGIDIAAPMGTPLLAADSGVVLVSGWRGGYGNYIAIDHGAGISTAYGHNSRLLVKQGETVVRGQRIALIGSTGLSTGPHLHFEVRINGQPTNPMNYLPRSGN